MLVRRSSLILHSHDDSFNVVKYYIFPPEGTSSTPAHKFCKFAFKDYCPEIFNQLRTWFDLDPQVYLSSLCGKFDLVEFSPNSNSGEFSFFTRSSIFSENNVTNGKCFIT
eukprot:UN31377